MSSEGSMDTLIVAGIFLLFALSVVFAIAHSAQSRKPKPAPLLNRETVVQDSARRSTRLSLQFPVVLTSLDPTCDFREECKTVVVNVHGCGVVVHQRLRNGTPMTVKLVSNGATKKARVVVAVPTLETTSWLLGLEFDSPENVWQVRNAPADWRV